MQGKKAPIFKVVFLKSLLPCFEFPWAVALLLLAQLILGGFPWQPVALTVQKMETLYNRAPEFTEDFTGRLIDICDFTVSCLSIKPDLLPIHKTEIKCLVASEIVSSIHTCQVTWVRLLITIWRMYCGSTFKLAEWLINLEVKKFTIISCATRGEKVHRWRPAGLVTVPGGRSCHPRGAVGARWPAFASRGGCGTATIAGAVRSAAGDVEGWLCVGLEATSAAQLQKRCWGEEKGGQAAGESGPKDLLPVVKKIAVMFAFGALAMSAELYSLLGIKS